ncbi:fasciclin domain-containing protein [Robertkochia flava]|uniref:fasciclin domain-containing protein n=1 Tax=Robertkochia flava TaxID=3447986 RepID=UPI001CCD8632|nr:fasciclin domain-containing protein [Robertkochia marina]
MKTYQLYFQPSQKIIGFAIMLSLLMVLMSCTNDQSDLYNDQDASLTEVQAKGKNMEENGPEKGPSIGQIALNSNPDEFNILVAALGYVDAELNAGLVNLFVNGTDQYTVFAPTDEAFVNAFTALEILEAGADLNETIALTIENGEEKYENFPNIVLNVLLYHVTDGRRKSNSVLPKTDNPKTIETLLDGATFQVNKDGSINAVGNTSQIVIMEDSQGVTYDISASNGIIHIINTVILPVNPADLPLKE